MYTFIIILSSLAVIQISILVISTKLLHLETRLPGRGIVYHTFIAGYNRMLHRLSQLSSGTHSRLQRVPRFIDLPTRAVPQRRGFSRTHFIIDNEFICIP